MNILYVNIDSIVSTLFTVDNKIVAYTEFDRNEDLLDKLSSLIITCEINKVQFIVRGMYSVINDSDNYVKCSLPINNSEYYCNVSKSDIDVIRHLCQTTNISSYRIVDRLGFYASMKKNNVCFVAPFGDMAEIVTVSNGVKDITYTRPMNVEAVLLQCKRNYGVTDFVDVNSCADAGLLSQFINFNDIMEKRALVAITMFAYLNTDASNYFELEFKVLKGEVCNTPLKWQGLIEKLLSLKKEVQVEKNNNTIKMKREDHSTLSSLLTVCIILLFISVIASFTITKYIAQDSAAIASQKDKIVEEIDNYEIQQKSLNSYLAKYDSDIHSNYLDKILAIKSKCCVGEIAFDSDNFRVTVYVNTEKDFNKFYKEITKVLNVESYQDLGTVSVNDTEMIKYELIVVY